MSEQKGQPTPEPEEQQQAPEGPEQQPGGAQPEGDVPDKYKGKSPEEIDQIKRDSIAQTEKLQSEIGKLSSQRKELEEQLNSFQQNMAYYQQMMQQGQYPGPQQGMGQPPQPGQASAQPNQEKFNLDWEDLPGSIERIVDGKINQTVSQYQEQQKQSNYQRSTQTFNQMTANKEFMKNNPELFKGIENEVVQAVGNAFHGRAQAGEDVSSALSDPNTWETVARFLKVQKGDFTGLMPEKNNAPMQAGETETPRANRNEGETMDIPPHVVAEWRREYPDITESEIRKIMKDVEKGNMGNGEFRFGG